MKCVEVDEDSRCGKRELVWSCVERERVDVMPIDICKYLSLLPGIFFSSPRAEHKLVATPDPSPSSHTAWRRPTPLTCISSSYSFLAKSLRPSMS